MIFLEENKRKKEEDAGPLSEGMFLLEAPEDEEDETGSEPEGGETDPSEGEPDFTGDSAGEEEEGDDDPTGGGDEDPAHPPGVPGGPAPTLGDEKDKKLKLFEEFEMLLGLAEQLAGAVSNIKTHSPDKSLHAVAAHLEDVVADARAKIERMLVKDFSKMEYRGLMYLFLVLKTTLTQASEVLKKINASAKSES
jgi:hypothetical protein